jgi:chromosome segregation ATPase
MAMPALVLKTETPVEERIARLEANSDHMRSDIADMKIDLRRLNDKVEDVDKKLTAKIDGVDEKLTAKIDGMDEKLTAKIGGLDEKLASLALAMEKGFAELRTGRALDRVWWLLMSAALLGVIARAVKWI